MQEPEVTPLSATYPRRIARLLAYVSAMAAGVLYFFYPPVTVIYQLDSSVPAKMWGVLLVIGGLTSAVSWFFKTLIIDRIGLSLIFIALFTMAMAQVALTIESDSWTHGGRTLVVIFTIGFVASRWMDVRHDELLDEQTRREFPG